MKGNVWAIAVLFMGLAVLGIGVNAAFADAAQIGEANESTTVDYDSNYTLGVTDVVNYTSLAASTNNTTLDSGTDYTFNRANASIDWINTSATTDGEAVWVNYTYRYHSATSQLMASTLYKLGAAVGLVAVMAVLGLILKIAPGGGGY